MKPYDGSLGIQSFGLAGPPASWEWIQQLVLQTVEATMMRYFNSDKPLKLLLDEKHRVQQTEIVLDHKLEDYRMERVVYEVSE